MPDRLVFMGRARGRDAENPRTRLQHGGIAEIAPSEFTSGFELVVDGTPQSHVDLDDPRHLHFEYVVRMGAVIDQLGATASAPLSAVHLGAGALTIPRYIAATRPGSRQQVIEWEAPLVELVREHLPLPKGAAIRMRIGDAREGLHRLPPALRGRCDLVVSDVFAGAQTPAHLTSVEFYREIAELLAPDGVLLVNVADGPGLAFARRQVATAAAAQELVTCASEAEGQGWAGIAAFAHQHHGRNAYEAGDFDEARESFKQSLFLRRAAGADDSDLEQALRAIEAAERRGAGTSVLV
jgi:spermidine synthase